jgi:hypothetical protein
MVGSKVAKVQCKQCGGYHRHKSPNDAKLARPVRERKPTLPARAATPALKIDPDKPIRPYRMSDVYQAGDQIQHLRFGVGVVESAGEPGKITVVFEDGRKFLAAGKAGSGLATANELSRQRRLGDEP